jgi:hypothetical protein
MHQIVTWERRRADSNRRMEVLQTSALPLGYGAEGLKAGSAELAKALNLVRLQDLVNAFRDGA